MKVKKELIPKLTESRNNKYHITFWFKNKRFRYSSGKIIGLDIQPNMEENSIRKRRAELLRSAFELEIEKGWLPEIKSKKYKDLLLYSYHKEHWKESLQWISLMPTRQI